MKLFINTDDGLSHNNVEIIHRDPNSVMWFETDSGIFVYDGVSWTSLDTRDNVITSKQGGWVNGKYYN